MRSPCRNPSLKHLICHAFTLVELLVVIGVIVLLMLLSIPAINMIKGAKNVESASWDMAGLLNQARSYAMAQNTHVWVGLLNDPDPSADEAYVAVVGSLDGSADSATATNLKQIHKGIVFRNLQFANLTGTPYGGRPGPDSAQNVSDADAPTSFPAQVGGESRTFVGSVVEFKPDGGAVVPGTSLARWLEIGLQPTRGDGSNSAAIQIAGVSGQVHNFRP